MSIQSEINRIEGLRDDSFDEVTAKGGTVPANATLDDLPTAIRSIPTSTSPGLPDGGATGQVLTKESDDDYDVDWAGSWSSLKSLILDLAHPVGSLYWSSDSTDPGTLFGGTWTRVKDRFILAAGDTYSAGATGGAATVTLTEAQLPSISGTIDTRKLHGSVSDYAIFHQTGGKFTYSTGAGGSSGVAGSAVSITSKATDRITFSFGSGNSHNNMPPYKVYYCWERTA